MTLPARFFVRGFPFGLMICSCWGGELRVSFPNSVIPLPAPVAATQRAVQAQQAAQVVKFGIALRLREFARMQERVAAGELISRAELERTHLPLEQDYAALKDWLSAQGLTITRQDPNRMLLLAQGPLAVVETVLQTHFVNVAVNGQAYHAADAAPSLPASLAPPVLGINHLQPFLQRHKHSIRQPLTNSAPPFKISEILKAYTGTGLGVTGAGQKIAILIDTFANNADLTAFWTNNGVSQSLTNIENINVNGGALPAATGEESLDVEWASGIAPGAKIRVYASGTLSDIDLDNCLSRMISDLPTQPQMHQLSISLGVGETGLASSQLDTDAQFFATLASGGVSVFVSSGDDGSTPNDAGASTGPLQVESYASDPSVTGVGGTSLFVNTSTGLRTSESGWVGSGGGLSIHFNRPSWQTGIGVPAGTKRCVPDVCLAADPSTGAYYLLNGVADVIGGTSWSTPTWAGFSALINQARAIQVPALAPLGLLNPRIYPLLGTNNFTDITTGSNSHFTTGPNAGKYPAGTGYDLVTGLGVPNLKNLLVALSGPLPPVPAVTISQIYGGGGNAGAAYRNDYIELFNTGTAAVDLTNWSVQYTSATGSAWSNRTNLTGSILPKHYYLVAGASNGAAGTVLPAVEVTGTIDLSATTGKVALVNSTAALAGTNPVGGATVVDFVGYGTTANGHEGAAPAGAPSVTNALFRRNGGITDTDNNAADFTTAAANPRNSSNTNPPLTPIETWRFQYFGNSANSGAGADTNIVAGDGLPNLIKYALGLVPNVPATTNSKIVWDTSAGFLRATVTKNPSATDVTYSLESTDPMTAGTWNTTSIIIDSSTANTLQAHDTHALANRGRRFARLRVTRP